MKDGVVVFVYYYYYRVDWTQFCIFQISRNI